MVFLTNKKYFQNKTLIGIFFFQFQVFDLLVAKYWGLKYATDAAATILRVDQIIMAKRAGGPRAPKGGSGPMDDGEDY